MTSVSYSIDAQVFARFPGYVRGVLIAEHVHNGASSPELVALLREAEAGARQQLDLDHLAENPRIAAWREAFRAMGVKPSEFRPSIEAMLRRVLHGQELPSINALVDIGNIVSLRYVLPVGSHAIDVMKSDIALRPATGEEEFVAFGSDVMEHPEKGEFIFAEGNTVLTRCWSWRQAVHTLTLPESTAVEINIDGLLPVTVDEVKTAGEDMMGLVKRFCGGEMRFEILSQSNPKIVLREK
jgi:DNA/RNA-binding domain of Phe-tRNA-synthetase-like protein